MNFYALEKLRLEHCREPGCTGKLTFRATTFGVLYFFVECDLCGESYAVAHTKGDAWALYVESYGRRSVRQRAKRAVALALESIAKELRR